MLTSSHPFSLGSPRFRRAPRHARRIVACAVIALAFGTSAVAHAAPGPASVDYTAYDRLLGEYVKVVSDSGQAVGTRFDYVRLFRAPDRAAMIERVRRQLLGVALDSLPAPDRLAWGINTYNFLVIRAVIANLFDPRSTRGEVEGYRTLVRHMRASVNDMRPGGKGFFEAPIVEIGGVSYNLDGFERKFVFENHPKDATSAPPRGLDPRAHFALNCAALGCPPLMPVAYRGDSLDRQLDFATRNALRGPGHFQWNGATGRLTISSIFHWYRSDFGGAARVPAFLAQHAPEETWRSVAALPRFPDPFFAPWDWNLNQLPAGPAPGGTP